MTPSQARETPLEPDDDDREFYEDLPDDDDAEVCPDCGCHLFSEDHDWDCAFYGEDDDDE